MSLRYTLKPLALFVGAIFAIVPPASYADDLPVKVGFAAPLTGANAGYGKDLENGVRLALEEANAQKIKIGDKVAQFQIVSEDDQADPRIGVQAAQKLVDAGVSAVVGHFNSGTTIPASQVYEQAGIPVIDPAATNPIITGRGFANTFMVISTDAQNAGNAGVYAVEVTKAKRIAIIDDRTAFGQGEADEFEKAVKAHGGNIVTREYTDNKAVDFSTQITKIKSTNADLIFFGGLDTQAAGFAKRMKQLGMNAQLVGGGGVMDQDFIKLAGDSAEGLRSRQSPSRPSSTLTIKTCPARPHQAVPGVEQRTPERHDLPDFRIFRSISADRKICVAASLLSRVKLVHHFVDISKTF